MKITESLQRIFTRGQRITKTYGITSGIYEQRFAFADTIFLNIVELLTDLSADVTFTCAKPDSRFTAFVQFFRVSGKVALTKVYLNGYVVIGHTSAGEGALVSHHFFLMGSNDYIKNEDSSEISFTPKNPDVELYVMRSSTFAVSGKSDKQLCQPFLEYIDNALNASNTVSARLGAVVVASPKNVSTAPAPVVLSKEAKEQLEKEIGDNYGALREQKQIMVLPREMSFQVVSLATLDQHTQDKVKTAILAIADRIKVPANQVGMIDANSSKSLANGTELREGDYNKYQSFERLLDQTFVLMAHDLGLSVDYTIYNKPARQSATI